MKHTGAEILCKSLILEGVDVIFGYPGGAIMPVYDALLKYPKLRHILVRHEQGAAHAAEGYARVTGKPGVCLVTSGPGATNLITGLADAMMDCVPLVCISGQVSSELIGNDAFQEADVVGITSMATKHNYLIDNPSEIAKAVKEAFHLANTGKPGPVMIDFTKDAQFAKTEYIKNLEVDLPGYKPVTKGNFFQIKKAAEEINKSKRPLILAGHGVLISKASSELLSLSQKADIPVACTLHGLSSIPNAHKNYVGMLGMHGNLAPNVMTNKADVLIGLGLRFDDRVTGKLDKYARQAKIIHVDIDPAEIGKNVDVEIPIVGDVKSVLEDLMPLINYANHKDWLEEFDKYKKEEEEKVIKIETKPRTGKIKMAEIVSCISSSAKSDAIIVADVGQNQMITARYSTFLRPNSFLTSGGLGTMGFGLPAGIGAKVGRPEREVWIIAGDGGFQMTIQEMMTIVQENLNVKIAVLNNNFLGMVRQWQDLFFEKKYSQVHMQTPDFIKISEGFGIKAEKVKERKDLINAIGRARKHKGAYLLEFEVEMEANVFPIMPTGAAVDEMRLE